MIQNTTDLTALFIVETSPRYYLVPVMQCRNRARAPGTHVVLSTTTGMIDAQTTRRYPSEGNNKEDLLVPVPGTVYTAESLPDGLPIRSTIDTTMYLVLLSRSNTWYQVLGIPRYLVLGITPITVIFSRKHQQQTSNASSQ